EALGFELVGVFRPAPPVEVPIESLPPEKRPTLRIVTVMAVFLSKDRKTEALVHSSSVVYENRSAKGSMANESLSFDSYGPNGEIVKTFNLTAETFLGKHPVNSWRRLPSVRSARALLAAHEEHARSRPHPIVAVDPTEHERRFAQRHSEELWYLEARGLVRFEGALVKGTRLLRARSLVNAFGPGLGEPRPAVAVALHAALGALGAAGALSIARPGAHFQIEALVAEASLLFIALATTALVLFRRSVLGSPLFVCIPAAVAFALHGVHTWIPWAAVTIYAVLGNAVRQQLLFAREKKRLESVLASATRSAATRSAEDSSRSSGERPPAASGG
ncbi:MAG: hypothetical protein ACAI25_13730, partial [Planctomycetota bacterium]